MVIMIENQVINGQINGLNSQFIETNRSLVMNESLINFHQNRYMRWHQNDQAFKVNSIDWNSCGEHLIVSSDDKKLRIFDLSGHEVTAIPSLKHGCDCVQFMTDNKTCVFASKYETKNGKLFDKIRHLDIQTKAFIHYYSGHENQVTNIAMNPNHNCFLSTSMDNTIRLWDCRLNGPIKTCDRISLASMKTSSRSVANFDPQGLVFAVGIQKDYSVRLYDMRNYTRGPFKISRFENDSQFGDWNQLKFSPNGKMISISTNGTKMRVIDSFSLQEISVLTGMKNDLKVGLELCWSPDSQYLFSGSSGSFARPGDYAHLNLFNAIDGKHMKNWKTMHESFMRFLKFNPKFYVIATACHDVSFWSPHYDQIKQLTVK